MLDWMWWGRSIESCNIACKIEYWGEAADGSYLCKMKLTVEGALLDGGWLCPQLNLYIKLLSFLYSIYFMVWDFISLENVLGVQWGFYDGSFISSRYKRDEGGNFGWVSMSWEFFLNEVLMIKLMDIVIMLGYYDGC